VQLHINGIITQLFCTNACNEIKVEFLHININLSGNNYYYIKLIPLILSLQASGALNLIYFKMLAKLLAIVQFLLVLSNYSNKLFTGRLITELNQAELFLAVAFLYCCGSSCHFLSVLFTVCLSSILAIKYGIQFSWTCVIIGSSILYVIMIQL